MAKWFDLQSSYTTPKTQKRKKKKVVVFLTMACLPLFNFHRYRKKKDMKPV